MDEYDKLRQYKQWQLEAQQLRKEREAQLAELHKLESPPVQLSPTNLIEHIHMVDRLVRELQTIRWYEARLSDSIKTLKLIV